MNELNNISNGINFWISSDLIKIILYGDKNFDNVTTFKRITSTIKFIQTTNALTILRIGLFGAAHGCGVQKGPLPKNCQTSYNDKTWHSYTLHKNM